MVPNFEKIKNCITSKSGIKNDRLDPDPPLLSYSPIISGYFFQKSGSRWSEVFCVEIGDILDLSTSCQIYTNLLKLKCNYISKTEIQKGCEFRKWSLMNLVLMKKTMNGGMYEVFLVVRNILFVCLILWSFLDHYQFFLYFFLIFWSAF